MLLAASTLVATTPPKIVAVVENNTTMKGSKIRLESMVRFALFGFRIPKGNYESSNKYKG